MRQFPDRDGPDLEGGDVFADAAFTGLKSRNAAFVVVRPETRAVVWANDSARAFFDAATPEALAAVLFGPQSGGAGWLDGLVDGVLPGRPPRLARGGLSRGFRMRAHTALIQAVPTTGHEHLVAFAVPESCGPTGDPEAWRCSAWFPERASERSEAADAEDPVEAPVESVPASDPGTTLARRSQIAILRDRLSAALNGAATLRLLWRTDEAGRVIDFDAASLARLGVRSSLLDGGGLADLGAGFDQRGGEPLRVALAGRTTWSGITLDLPVAGGAARVPMTLSGSPILGPGRSFAGFRGFATVDLGRLDLAPQPEVDTAAVPTGDDAREPEQEPGFEVESASEPVSAEGGEDDAVPARPTSANVVHLRAFQALASGRFGTQANEPAPVVIAPAPPRLASADPDPIAPSDASPPAATISDDLAFQALGDALRARIEGLHRGPDPASIDLPASDPFSADPAPPGPDEAVGSSREEPASEPAPVPSAADAGGVEPQPLGGPSDATALPGDAGPVLSSTTGPARPAAAPPSSEAVADVAMVLRHLPVPLVVTIDIAPVFANVAALRLLGWSAGEEPEALDGSLLASGTGRVTLRDAQHRDVTLDARATDVSWNGLAATLWLLSDPAEMAKDDAATIAGDLLDRVDDAVALLDGSGLVRRLNRRGEIWFAGARGQSFEQLLAPDSRPAALALLDQARMQGDGAEALPLRQDVRARLGDGTSLPMMLTLGRSGPAEFYLTLRDLSALRRAETERAGAERDHLRDADRLPGLLGKVSHEIRTPLNAILGFAEVMMDERFGPLGNPRYKDYLTDIHASGLQVMTLVEDLLDLSRIEAGQLDLSVSALDVNRIVAETVAQMQPEAHRERVIMRTSLAGRIPAVLADERSARQIVRNLLSNAVKFNEPGGQVIVSTALSDSGSVLLRVRDTGIGMTDDEIAAAMEPFGGGVSPHPANGNASGNGLGLPLTRALVGVNGASMAISSRPREGTLVEVAFASAGALDERRPA